MESIPNWLITTSLLIILWFAFRFIPFGYWNMAKTSGIQISILRLTLMNIRKAPVRDIVHGLIEAKKAGIKLTPAELETLTSHGGNIRNVVNGMIAAKQAGSDITFQTAKEADAKGIDITQLIQKQNTTNNP